MHVGQMLWGGLFEALYVVLLIASAVVPAWLIIRTERKRQADPAYLRQFGVVVRRLSALDAVAEVIGRYNGAEIYRFVVFKGMRYYFDRVIPAALPRRVGRNELYLDPGVVYRTA